MPTPEMRVHTAKVSMVLYVAEKIRACIRDMVCGSPRPSDLWIKAQEPVEFQPAFASILPTVSVRCGYGQEMFWTFPTSFAGAYFAGVWFDVNQEKDRTPLRLLRKVMIHEPIQ